MATKLRLTPTQRFSNFFKVVKIFAMVCGANIFRADYRFNPLTGFVVGVILTFFGFTCYSMYVGVVIDQDFTTILQSLCYTGAAIQGATKLVVSLYYAKLTRYMCSELLNIYEEYECKNERFIQHLQNTLSSVKRAVFILLEIYSIQTIGVLTVPLLYYFLWDQHIDIIPLLIPGIDKNSHFGFYIYQFYHICCVCFASFGNFASDSYMVLLVVHVPLFKNILKLKFDHLDEILQEYPRDAERTGPLLKEILQWHQTSIAFSQNVTKIFFWIIFVQIFSSTFAIICIMVCHFLGVWPAAPVYMMYCFAILYMFCGLGNLIEISNDDLTQIIYDCNWYELTVSEQKMILIMLRKSQQAPTMTVGGFMPLSLNTALQLTKSIYTAAMILNEFLN